MVKRASPELVAAYLFCGILSSALAQSPAVHATFDVASIKPTDPASRGGRIMASAGRFNAAFATVKSLIMWAYDVKDYQISGGPAWLGTTDRTGSERFDVAAKAEADTTTDQIRLMLQSLLADRFGLKLHRETRELPVYDLVVGKNGPKLREASGDVDQGLRMMPEGLAGRGASIAQLVAMLVNDRPVLDKTGLAGKYDFRLTWKDDDPNSPSLFTAIQDQLGLKLESSKAPVGVLVIDACSKSPSEN